MVGQVTPRAAQGGEEVPAESSGLQEAIQYMKQEVDDAQRIAQMMEVRAQPCTSPPESANHCICRRQLHQAERRLQ